MTSRPGMECTNTNILESPMMSKYKIKDIIIRLFTK